ncbi:MAG: CBS domain-containing protein [Candidatus Aenigmatarchaeota archaeon]
MHIKDVMSKEVVALQPDETLWNALKTFSNNDIGGCPIVNTKKSLVGIITQTDILEIIDAHSRVLGSDMLPLILAAIKNDSYDGMKSSIKKILNMKIRKFASMDVVTIEENSDIYNAAKLMSKHKINSLPVVKGRKLTGVVSKSDVIKALGKMKSAE